MPACVADHTTSTRYTMPAAVGLAPSRTSTNVVATANKVATNQWKMPRESDSPCMMFITGIIPGKADDVIFRWKKNQRKKTKNAGKNSDHLRRISNYASLARRTFRAGLRRAHRQ